MQSILTATTTLLVCLVFSLLRTSSADDLSLNPSGLDLPSDISETEVGLNILEVERKEANDEKRDEEDDLPLSFEDLPAAVQEVLLAELPGLEIAEIEREEDGVFEIEGTVDGQEVELVVKTDGEIVRLKVERDEEDDLPLSFEDLPAAVQEVLLAELPGLEIAEIEREEDGVFEIEGTVDGQEVELVVKTDGEIVRLKVERDEEDDLPLSFEDLPAAVQEVLLAELPGLEIAEIEREEDGVFEIEGTVDGQEVELVVKTDGEIVRLEVERDEEDDLPLSFEDLPAAVQEVLLAELPGLEIAEIEREDDGFFEIEGTVDGQEVELVVKTDGEIVRLEVERDEEDDLPLSFEDLPAAVQEVLLAELPGLEIAEIEREEDGFFEIEGTVDGQEVELVVKTDGEIVRLEVERDEEDGDEEDDLPLSFEDLPAAVQEVLLAELPGLEIAEIEREEDGFFEIEGTVDGQEVELVVKTDGEIVRLEVERDEEDGDEEDDLPLSFEDLPAAVQEVLLAELPGLEIAEIEREDDGFFEIEGTVDGQEVELVVKTDGEIVRLEVERDEEDDLPLSFEDLPAAVQEALLAELPGLEIAEIEREDDGVFEIEGTVDGQEVELVVKTDGEIVRLEVERDEEDDLPLSFEDLPAAVQEALLAELPGLEIAEIEREDDGVFEIEGTVDGQEVELVVKTDGEIVRLEVERDEEHEEKTRTTISLDEVPASVLAKLEEVAPGLEIRKVQLDVHAEGEQVYIFKGKLRGPSVKIEISAEGEVVHAGKGPKDDDLDPLNGCTRGVGYWKNHLDDPAWAVLGPDVAFFQSGQTHAEILHTPTRGDAYVILARTYISALLNEENGAVPAAEIEATMELAETWFETVGSSRPVPPSTEDGRMAVALAELLDSFNRGLLGASHCEGESDAPGEGDELGEEDEGEENEEPGNDGGEELDEPGEGPVVEEVTPLEVDLKDLPEQARAVGLSGVLQLKIATEVGFHYRFECLNTAERWQPLGGKFRGDGEEKVVRVPVGQVANCSLFRVKITRIAQAEGGARAGTEGEEPPVKDDELAGGGGA